MADTLNFEITFHGPLRIASGRAERGLDDTIDLHDPFPASTMKGPVGILEPRKEKKAPNTAVVMPMRAE